MDFKSLISKIESIDGPIETPKAPETAAPIRLDEDTEMRVLAGVTVLTESIIAEKAVSKAQQKFMGMVHAAQKGEPAASPEVAKVAKDMPKKAAKDYAETKHKGLPEKKKKDESLEVAEAEDRAAPKKSEREVELPSGAKVKATKVQGWQSQKADKESDKDKKKDESIDKTAFKDKFTKMVEAKKDKMFKKDKKMDEAAKPDFLDIDKDGNKKEPMKKAAADKGGDKKDGKKGMSAKQEKYFGKKTESKMMPKGKKRPVKESLMLEDVDMVDDFVGSNKSNFKGRYNDDFEKVQDNFVKFLAKKGINADAIDDDGYPVIVATSGGRPVAWYDLENASGYIEKSSAMESVETKLSFKDMVKLVQESGGQQQIDPIDKNLFNWASRVARNKLGEGMKAELYAGLIYERNGGVFEMYDILSEDQK